MDAGIVGLLGTAVGAIASFGGTAISNWFLIKKEREDRKYQHEEESVKWEREQLKSGLLKATLQINIYISKYLGKSLEEAQNDQEIVSLSADVKQWIVATLMSYPNKSHEIYQELASTLFEANYTAVIEEKHAWKIRQILISLAMMYQVSPDEVEK